MKEPLKSGDLAEVINGLLGPASPNLGLIVRVKQLVGELPELGRIWRCEAEYGERIQPRPNIPAGLVDFSQHWLRKIQPPPAPSKAREKEEAA